MRLRPVLALLLAAAPGIAQGPVLFPLDPRTTYLRRYSDPAPEPVPIDLSIVGAVPGTVLHIRQVGDWDAGPYGDIQRGTIGVLSNGPTLLAATNQHRVPGAVASGCPAVTGPTFWGALPTDIPEDFRISVNAGPWDAIVEVPPGATHLFACASDSLYHDNSDPDGDYGVELQVIAAGTWTDLGMGLAGTNGVPVLTGQGTLANCAPFTLQLASARPSSLVGLVLGFSQVNLPLFGGTLVPSPDIVVTLGSTDGAGSLGSTFPIGFRFPSGFSFYVQEWVLDPLAPSLAAASNGLRATFP